MNRRLLGLVLALLPGALFGSAASGVAPWLYPSPPTNGQTWVYNSTDKAWEPGSGGGGTVTSITNSDGSLTLSPNPIVGAGTISLALGHPNTWAAVQTFSLTDTSSSGTAHYGVAVTPVLSQTSTAGFTGVFENVTGTGGSGAQNLIDLQVGGSSKFHIDNGGNATFTGSVTTTTAAAGNNSTLAATTAYADAAVAVVHGSLNSESAAYTTVLSDQFGTLYHPSSDTAARTFTIASNANVAYPLNTIINFFNDVSAGVLTIAITSDTLVQANAGTTGSVTLAAGHTASALKVATTRWVINVN